VRVSEATPLAGVIREHGSEILAAWIARFEQSPLRFRRTTKAAEHTAQVASLVDALGVAATSDDGELRLGSPATRELEQAAAFLGAQFASEGATGFDIAALLLELRDVCSAHAPTSEAARLTLLFEWLTVIALDAFASAGLQSLRERQADQLETGTPIVELLPKVPALLLVGAPNASVIDNLFARAWMLAVGSGAPCLILDCAGLAEPGERAFEAGYGKFLEEAGNSVVQVLLSGARRQLRERIAAQTGEKALAFQHFDRLDSAVAHAMERAGYHLVRRS
jgi:hypothetical protein